ncbi:hypothetical protein PILCRDRAFT_97057 [Piloderma croceum F 1598]|uniref:MBOAT-domain-containing protein n=1 Tax=Piloderma croceum (strain F 1598) TaxID=765440 RepID=A0A0C3C316_PILCF|nr:hypothetical protein PILCRDRAFT_97057 [Piloderma croceum F 1598]
MDAIFIPVASMVGASLDQVKLISCLLISYPLGSLFIRIPSSQPGLKHIFNLTVTLVYLLPVLNMYSALLQLLGSVIGTYMIAANVRGPRMPWIVFVFLMGHLLVNHIIRAIYHPGYDFGITAPQMVLTMKLSTFAWNVWDGRRPVADLDKWQSEKRVTKYPSLLEFLGFSFYFPGFLVGPYLEYSTYMSLIDESIYKSTGAHQNITSTKSGRNVPDGRKRVAYRKMAFGLAWLGVFVVLGGSYNFAVALQPWFATRSLLYRIAYFHICGVVERSKYYALWILTEGAGDMSGLGFTGYSPTGQSLWQGATNVNVLMIEFAPNFKVLLDSWNTKTNVWLRECVYKRVTPKGKKPGFRSSMTTFVTSAVWHGIAGGYYLTFLLGGFMSSISRLSRANIRPLLLPPPGAPPSKLKRAYDIAGIIITVICMDYIAAPFMLLSVRNSLAAWRALDWYGLWIIFGGLAFFYAGFPSDGGRDGEEAIAFASSSACWCYAINWHSVSDTRRCGD